MHSAVCTEAPANMAENMNEQCAALTEDYHSINPASPPPSHPSLQPPHNPLLSDQPQLKLHVSSPRNTEIIHPWKKALSTTPSFPPLKSPHYTANCIDGSSTSTFNFVKYKSKYSSKKYRQVQVLCKKFKYKYSVKNSSTSTK